MVKITAKDFKKILDDENIIADELQNLVVQELIKNEKKVATAESCTGGLLSKRITEVPGVSSVVECGVCSYANRIKNKVLGVKSETLKTVGAVSPETAKQMAVGIKSLANSDFSVSTTGIAGPTGGSEEKPVGLVYIGVACNSGVEAVKADLSDAQSVNRETVRKLASDVALYCLLKKIKNVC